MNLAAGARLGILSTIGHTPITELRSVAPDDCARVLVKLECLNPTGSMKDRMARSVIEAAVISGRLSAGGRVVEYTGGSTGTSLAFVCAALGFQLTVVTSDAFSQEKRDQMRAFGATVVELPSEDGRTTKELIQRMMAEAARIGAMPNTFYVDQFNNPDAASGYVPLAKEAADQCGLPIDAFVQSVGTAQCISGVAAELRKTSPGVLVVAVEPSESPVLSGGRPGPHKIEGVGPGFVPPRWSPSIANEVVHVPTEEARGMARRLAREEALFAGTSTGANVAAAIAVGRRLGRGKTVMTLACDTGLKYLSTDLYAGTRG